MLVGGTLYVAGGYLNLGVTEQATATVLAYDRWARRWRPVAPLPSPRARLRLVALGGGSGRAARIAVVGGCRLHNQMSTRTRRTTEVYDPGTNRWQLLTAQLPVGLRSLSAAEAGGTLLAIGGAVGVGAASRPSAAVYAVKF